MTENLCFKNGELYFEVVLDFYSSWIAYCALHTKERHAIVNGRLRGMIVPQIEFKHDKIILKLANKEQITELNFTLSNKNPGDPKGSKIETASLVEFWSTQMVGHAFESTKDLIQKKFGTDRKNTWPEILQFFYHLRNASFHSNKFHFIGKPFSSLYPAKWRGVEIKIGLQGQKMAGRFMTHADFITLLHDLKNLMSKTA